MMNEVQFPWLILVPGKNNIRELHDLAEDEQLALTYETSSISKILLSHFNGDKINIGALGNLVPQFHMHVIVRYENDHAWPKPVWGNFSAHPYSDREQQKRQTELTSLLADNLGDFDLC